MTGSNIDINEIICKLLHGLKDKGYSIGTDAYIKTTEIFDWFLSEKKNKPIGSFALYLAPVICKNKDEQVNFKKIFDEKFLNEFIEFEKKYKEEAERENEIIKKEKDRKRKKIIWTIAAVILIICSIPVIRYLNRPYKPELNYKDIVEQPLFVSRNKSWEISHAAVFNDPKDSSDFNAEYKFHGSDKIEKGITVTHHFERYGKDTLSVRLTSGKYSIDTTLFYPEIYVGPENVISINAAKDFITTREQNEYTATLDTSLKVSSYWMIDSNRIDNKRSLNNKLTYSFDKEGDHFISINYDPGKDSFLQKFPKAFLSASYVQKVVKQNLQLTTSNSSPPLITKTAVSKIWLAALLVIFLSLLYAVFRIIRKRKKSQSASENIENFNGSNPPYDIYFISKEQNISGNYSLLRLSNDLKKRIESGYSSLDIPQTIRQSIFNRGFLSPQFSQKQVNREYLFLIDHAYANSQQVKLFSYLARFLIQHSVKLDFYFYNQIPDKFYKDIDAPSIKLDDLKDQYYKAALIIFSDGTNFIDYRRPVVKDKIINALNYWQNRVLITPTPVNDWARDERILSSFFNMLPADMQGLLELIRAIDSDNNSDMDFLKAKFSSYKTKYVDFDNVDALREYLDDEELFQWLCALAIHPKIYWDIILEIGKAILKDPALTINYETLLKISRIQWITEGSFPPPTRLALLKKLTKENEIKARETMLRMLDELPTGENMFSYEEKELSRYTNSFVLSATGIEKYKSNKKIQEAEQKFISLYKNKKLVDIPFKIYIEKKQTENDNWDTPVVTDEGDNGIEQYIKIQDKEKLREERSKRIKTNKTIARFLAGAAAILFFTGYLFFSKDSLVNSNTNKYLHLINKSTAADNTVQVNVFITGCLNKLLLESKDTTAQFEARTEGSVLFSNKIKYSNIPLFPMKIEGLKYDSAQKIIFTLTIPGQPPFTAERPLTAGICDISLEGICDADKPKNDSSITVHYYPGYKEDSLPIIKEIRNMEYHANVFSTTNKAQLDANLIAFTPDIDTAKMYEFANRLIAAGFHLKHLQYTAKTESHYINIVNDNYYNNKPDITTDSLNCLLNHVCKTAIPSFKTSAVQIFYNNNIISNSIKKLKECIKGSSSFDIAREKYTSGFSNDQVLYYGDSLSDKIVTLRNCLKTYFPDKKFNEKKSSSSLKSNAAVEIYLYNLTKIISVEISDESLRRSATEFRKTLLGQGYTVAAVENSSRNYNSVIEYYDPQMSSAASQVKDLYRKYFPDLPIETKFVKNQEQRDVSDIVVWIKKYDPVPPPRIPKAYLQDVKFPRDVSSTDKLNLGFNIVTHNGLPEDPKQNISNQINQSNVASNYAFGQICISGEKNCISFRFRSVADGIQKFNDEIDMSNVQPGRHEIRVKIDNLKIDTSLGFFNLQSSFSKENLCDTIHSYIGLGKGNVLFNGRKYADKFPKGNDLFMTIIEKNNNYGKFTISTGKCEEMDLTLYVNKSQTIQLCDGQKITFTLLPWQDKESKFSDREAIFDAIICKPNNKSKY